MDAKFYVYAHLRATGPRAGSVFYIGKGQGRRALEKTNRNSRWKRTVEKYGHEVVILADGMTDAEAYALEADAVLALRGLICNITPGGRGLGSGANHPMYGKRHSKESIEKALATRRTKTYKRSPEAIKAAIETRRKNGNLRHTKESIEKMVATRRAIGPSKQTPESIAAMIATRRARGTDKQSQETIEKRLATRRANGGFKRNPDEVARGWATRRANAAKRALDAS